LTHREGVSTVPDDPEVLQARLKAALRRQDDASPHSPDWDAATEGVEDVMRRLERALREQPVGV
jgi:DNA-binding response OmpR family regulator